MVQTAIPGHRRYASGQQFHLQFSDQHATVVEVGGGIREYTDCGRAVLESYPADNLADGAHGAPLIPWPNRIEDGAYDFDGITYQFPLTEPARSNAIHGLLRWVPWQGHRVDDASVTMTTTLYPSPGYPFLLTVEIDYRLGEEGLTVTTTATNDGTRACPYGTGQHPYLSAGTGSIDGAWLELDAVTRIRTDPVRALPSGEEPVAGTPYDFRRRTALAGVVLDDPFTDLTRGTDGRAWARLTGSDGRQVQLWVDQHYTVVQLYSGDSLSAAHSRTALAVEPMTCPPNAFRTKDGLIILQPGQKQTTKWGVRLR